VDYQTGALKVRSNLRQCLHTAGAHKSIELPLSFIRRTQG